MGDPGAGVSRDDGTIGMTPDGKFALFDADGLSCCCDGPTDPDFPCPNFKCDCTGTPPVDFWDGRIPSPETNFDPFKRVGPVCSNFTEFRIVDLTISALYGHGIGGTSRVVNLNVSDLPSSAYGAAGAGGYLRIDTNNFTVQSIGNGGFPVPFLTLPVTFTIKQTFIYPTHCTNHQSRVESQIDGVTFASELRGYNGGPECKPACTVLGEGTGPGVPAWDINLQIREF